ncbi:hypothetical protein GCM10023080_034730 [Streptomyces pseudoechinosporeus]
MLLTAKPGGWLRYALRAAPHCVPRVPLSSRPVTISDSIRTNTASRRGIQDGAGLRQPFVLGGIGHHGGPTGEEVAVGAVAQDADAGEGHPRRRRPRSGRFVGPVRRGR